MNSRENKIVNVVEAARAGIILAQNLCHSLAWNAGWWHDMKTGKLLERNKGETIMLMVTELAEAYEGVRKGEMDSHLPHRTAEEVELADVLIRVLDYAGGHGLDLGGAMIEKLQYNQQRADHKIQARLAAGGKKT